MAGRRFTPQDTKSLKEAINECLEISRSGLCSNDPNGPVATWDVSQITNMKSLFREKERFNRDLSSWNVARVTDMTGMFKEAKSFNHDLSPWNVARVTDMAEMFKEAELFNHDLSSWNVARVTDMTEMFYKARNFAHVLCGVHWINSRASKDDMFINSRGSIANAVCTTSSATTTFLFPSVTPSNTLRETTLPPSTSIPAKVSIPARLTTAVTRTTTIVSNASTCWPALLIDCRLSWGSCGSNVMMPTFENTDGHTHR